MSAKQRLSQLESMLESGQTEADKLKFQIKCMDNHHLDQNDHGDGHGGGHDKHEDAVPCTCAYQLLWITDALFIVLMKYVFCIIFAILIHSGHEVFEDSLPIGINVQVVSVVITCTFTSALSQVGVSIAGPDMIFALFNADMAKIIGDRVDAGQMAMAGAVPTLLLVMALTTMLIGVSWTAIGYARVTHYVDLLPVSVQCGFLACIGYKVCYYAIKLSVGDAYYYFGYTWKFWKLFLAGIPLGVLLHYINKFDDKLKVPPVASLPTFLILPIIAFYLIMFAMSEDTAYMREEGWMFDPVNNTMFYKQWTELLLNLDKIDWISVLYCIPSMLAIMFITTLDVLVKIKSTKTQCKLADIDMATEMKIAGIQNLLVVFAIGAPGYTQVKFNVMNYHIIHNTKDRKPGFVVAGVCAVLFFFSLTDELLAILPRFFIGMLLAYSAIAFVEDNLFYSYNRVTKKEFVCIWVVMLLFAVVGFYSAYALLVAFGSGLVIATFIFLIQYARSRVIRDFVSGRDFQSVVVRPFIEQKLVENIGVRFAIIELEGFLFFGSAAQIVGQVRSVIDNNKKISSAQRVRYLLIDFKHVSNADNSSIDQFHDIDTLLTRGNIHLIFSGLNAKLRAHFEKRHLIAKAPGKTAIKEDPHAPKCIDYHIDIDHAAEYVEELLLSRSAKIRQLWLVFDSFRKVHTEALIKTSCETFEAVIGSTHVGTSLWKYASLKRVAKGELLCEQGTYNKTLYVLQEGLLTSYITTENGSRRRLHKMSRGAFINDECLFLDLSVGYNVIADRQSVVWAITQESMRKMERNDPNLALEIVRRVLRHTSTVRMRLEREVHAISRDVVESEAGTTDLLSDNAGTNPAYNRDKKNHHQSRKAATSKIGSHLGDAIKEEHHTSHGIVEHHGHHFVHIPNAHDLEVVHAEKQHVDEHDFMQYDIHLCKHDIEDARRCFYYHAEHKDGASDSASVNSNEDERKGFVPAELGVHSMAKHKGAAAREFMSGPMAYLREKQSLGDDALEIDLLELEKVVMDLGLFPSHEEITDMHRVLGHGSDTVSMEEFMRMIELMKLAPIGHDAKKKLYSMYISAAEPDKGLPKEGLADLITQLGGDIHDQDKEEAFSHIMADWDVHHTGYLTFDAFMSIFSMFLKKQETEVEFMNDFKRFCPKFIAETDLDDADNSQLVQADNIMDVFFGLQLPMTKEIAEEMVFDADLDHNDGVSYDDLICAISTIGINEVYSAMEGEQQGLRVVQEIKRIEQFDSHRSGGSAPQLPNPYLESKVNLRKARASPPIKPQVPNSVVESKVDLPNRAAPPTDLGFEKVILPNRAIRAAPSADLEEEVYHLPNRTSPKAESLKMTIQTRVSGLRKDFLGDATPADSSPTAYLL